MSKATDQIPGSAVFDCQNKISPSGAPDQRNWLNRQYKFSATNTLVFLAEMTVFAILVGCVLGTISFKSDDAVPVQANAADQTKVPAVNAVAPNNTQHNPRAWTPANSVSLPAVASIEREQVPPTDAEVAAKIPQKLAECPMAQKILGLTANNAYATGATDGEREVKETASKSKLTADELEKVRELQNAFFDLMEAAQLKFSPAVFQEYKRGWNDGAKKYITTSRLLREFNHQTIR